MRLAPLVFAALAVSVIAACGNSGDDSASPTPAPAVAPSPAAAKAPPAPPPVEPTGAVDDAAFLLKADAVGPYAAGSLSQFSVTLVPKEGYHVNHEFPIRVEIDAPALTLPKRVLERTDAAEFEDERARFDVPFIAAAAGTHKVMAKVSFAVCTPETCIPDERTLALDVAVQ
ncbi:MAG: hypothetical protein R3A78_01435 [Polyangiales bacterium]|nr:hypothetical protein [Myxococcales bacterium]